MTIGKRIEAMRKKMGLSKEELLNKVAEREISLSQMKKLGITAMSPSQMELLTKLGIHQIVASYLESGREVKDVASLAAALGVTEEWLKTGGDDSDTKEEINAIIRELGLGDPE